eukprot:gnl/Trimastix_PCT/910.p1 GENE.gnl/Trimastix_PCT/910~~gnl/Trimastix_PCT/910.p1  ORF type:complete len:1077 (-),score=298.97 gnl/Trimastix_PCT/910:140-3370(-)
MSSTLFDVAIIGGGASGCAIARELSKFQLKTVLVERCAECCFGTSKANSGIVHSGHQLGLDTLKGRLVTRGNRLIAELAKELHFGFKQCGEIVIVQSEEDWPKIQQMVEWGESKGEPMIIWDQQKLREEEPSLSHHLLGALYAPTAGVVNPYEFVNCLMESAEKNGVEFVGNFRVSSIDRPATEDAPFVLHAEGRSDMVQAKWVINAAGVYADLVADMAGAKTFTITPRKGEEYLLDKKIKNVVQRIVFPVPTAVSKGILIIPTVDGTMMCGPTAENQDDREDVSTTVDGCTKVFSTVTQYCSAIQQRDVIASFAGLRAASNTGDFIIEASPVKRFINCGGIQSPGLTAAPAIAEYVVNILREEGLALASNDAFVGTIEPMPHFIEQPVEEQRRLAAANPLFGKIVCRCEQITEGDIHAAIDHGARTLDGVKFRTRAGMGRCQSGFCTSRIMEILRRRLGLKADEITKRGGESVLMHPDIEELVAAPDSAEELAAPTPDDLKNVYDIVIIGGGPAGLAAGVSAREAGAVHVVVLDREPTVGGILLQCIHSGFGVEHFGQELTGPEYAERFIGKAMEAGVQLCSSAFVLGVDKPEEGGDGLFTIKVLYGSQGVQLVRAKSVVLAMGCRERTRPMIRLGGTRPAGVMTAGLCQKLMNMDGYRPGRKAVILGSGDIGLIMARRLTLEGCEVQGVFEIMPYCNGLNRNVVQCLNDYGISLHLGHTVVRVHGNEKLERVTVAPVDQHWQPDMSRAWDIECDTLLLSVGLIPENELSSQAGVQIDRSTSGPQVTSSLMTNVPGIFACGNVLHVHDVADNASAEAILAGRSAAQYASSHTGPCPFPPDNITLEAGDGVMYVLPKTLNTESNHVLSLRARRHMKPAMLRVGDAASRRFRFAIPAEMIRFEIKREQLQTWAAGQPEGTPLKLTVTLEEVQLPQRRGQPEADPNTDDLNLQPGEEHTQYVCLSCPNGCPIDVIHKGREILRVLHNKCPRGIAYVEQEHRDPKRVFSTTIAIGEGHHSRKVPVKLSAPIPKEKLIDAAREIRALRRTGAALGETVLENLCGLEGVNVVACRTMQKPE